MVKLWFLFDALAISLHWRLENRQRVVPGRSRWTFSFPLTPPVWCNQSDPIHHLIHRRENTSFCKMKIPRTAHSWKQVPFAQQSPELRYPVQLPSYGFQCYYKAVYELPITSESSEQTPEWAVVLKTETILQKDNYLHRHRQAAANLASTDVSNPCDWMYGSHTGLNKVLQQHSIKLHACF